MKNIINYYYNFNVDNIKKHDNYYEFFYFDRTYLFYELDKNMDYNHLYEVLEITKNIPRFHTPINNIYDSLITFDGKNNFLLLRVNINENRNIVLNDFFYLSKYKFNNINKKFNWNVLWMKKIDYLEYFLNEKDDISNEIKILFNYYIGLSENAIKYLNLIGSSEYIEISLTHKRISSNSTLYDFYNPINIVFDHLSRDIAEYFKSLFLNKKNFENELNILISSETNSSMYKFLFARLLYFTNFYDILDDHELIKKKDEDLTKLFDITYEYENFIIYIYYKIKNNRKIDFPIIDWLINR